MTVKRVMELINRTHVRGVKIHREIDKLSQVERSLEALNRERRRLIRKVGRPITMYDSVTVSAIPLGAEAVAGYVGGSFPTYVELNRDFPHANRLSIAVNSREVAECLDVENGDATPAQVASWIESKHSLGNRPCIYADLSTMPSVIYFLKEAKISRNKYRLWVAHYTGVASIPEGFDACQYTQTALGRNLDASICLPGFFD